MLKITEDRFEDFKVALRRHWPNLTDRQIQETGGEFEKVLSLIERVSFSPVKETRELLEFIYDEVGHGNPNTIDDFAGIDLAQHEHNTSESNEWEARESMNEDENEKHV